MLGAVRNGRELHRSLVIIIQKMQTKDGSSEMVIRSGCSDIFLKTEQRGLLTKMRVENKRADMMTLIIGA